MICIWEDLQIFQHQYSLLKQILEGKRRKYIFLYPFASMGNKECVALLLPNQLLGCKLGHMCYNIWGSFNYMRKILNLFFVLRKKGWNFESLVGILQLLWPETVIYSTISWKHGKVFYGKSMLGIFLLNLSRNRKKQLDFPVTRLLIPLKRQTS